MERSPPELYFPSPVCTFCTSGPAQPLSPENRPPASQGFVLVPKAQFLPCPGGPGSTPGCTLPGHPSFPWASLSGFQSLQPGGPCYDRGCGEAWGPRVEGLVVPGPWVPNQGPSVWLRLLPCPRAAPPSGRPHARPPSLSEPGSSLSASRTSTQINPGHFQLTLLL